MTGVGVVSGLGVGTDAFWSGLVEGRSSLGPLTAFDPSGLPVRLAGQIPDLDPKQHMPKSYRKAVKVMARDSAIAAVAASLAVRDAGLATRESEGEPSYPPGSLACHIGAGLIASDVDEMAIAAAEASDETGRFDSGLWGERGLGLLQPLWLLKYLPNMLACHVSIIHGCEGPSNTITCSESSGLLSVGESARVIERGDAQAGLAGSAESKVTPLGIVRYVKAGRLAATGEHRDGSRLVMPYDPGSSGRVVGEGGGIVVLESMESALGRGVEPLAEVLGFGAAQSGAELSELVLDAGLCEAPVNTGLEQAIRAALDDSGHSPDAIDAIVPQGAGQPFADASEAGALRAVFGERLKEIPLITLCPMVGECFAGNGGLQIAAGCLALRHQRVPARIHEGRAVAWVDAGPSPAHDREVGRVLVCSSSLGGSNAAVVLGRVRSRP